MPWQPWHWAILFSSVTWLLSAAYAATGTKPAKSAAIASLETDMGAMKLLLEFGSPELYRRVLLEERFPRARRRQVEPLSQQDADLCQLARDLLGLDVLGDGLQPQARADAMDGFHQRVVQVAFGDAFHEEAVHLDAIDRKVLEVVERRKPAAEVIEQEASAHRAQALDERARAFDVGDRGRFRDLKRDGL